MNLFFKKLFGQLLSTEKYEQQISEMGVAVQRYRQIEQSNDWKEYQLLREAVHAAEFLAKKKQLQSTKYKQTTYYALLKELNDLKNNKKLQAFLAVQNTTLLKDFLDFRNSPDYVKLSDKNLVKASDDLKRWADFEKSKKYKAYLAMKDSSLPARYSELQKQTADEVFQQENIFWSNPNRWVTTEEYKQETRYKQLAKNPDIQFFLAQNKQEIERRESYHQTFADEFDWKRLDDSAWRAGFAYASPILKRHHSFVNEQQAYNEGKNCGTINGIFTLLTKEEATMAAAWDEKRGFVNKEFAYTSDVVTTAEAFRQQEGLFAAKVRCSGAINHVAWMGSDKQLPLVKFFHFNGKKLYMGNTTTNGFIGEQIKGINPQEFYIYSIVWNKRELIWYVNNLEVYRTANNIPQEALYLAFSSFISAGQRGAEGKIEADWVRVYTIK